MRIIINFNNTSNPSFSSVAANGALALPIRIPVLKETFGKGAALLKVSYYYKLTLRMGNLA